jgi:cell shape-determining protein MreD
MSWLSPALLFVVAWLAVFAQTQFPSIRGWLGTPPGIIPALVVYAAFTHGIGVVTSLCVLAGLWLDALSGSRLGASIGPLFLVGFALHARQHLLLREQRYAQFWLGLGAGVLVPLATGALLTLGVRQPFFGGGTVAQLAVSGVLNGLMCPAAFLLFDRLRSTWEYQAVGPGPFRADREIKRGRT